MGVWIADNWFNLLSAVGIVGSLLFTAFSLRVAAKSRQIGNLPTITAHHREIWSALYHQPELARVKEASVDLARNPITPEEALFVKLLILHLSSAYLAMKNGVLIKPEEVRADLRQFFSYPIPKAVWEKSKLLQKKDFADFVEQCQFT